MEEKTGKVTLPDSGSRMVEDTTTPEQIVAEYSGRVFNLAFRMLHSREDAEEATQDTFMRVFRSIKNFNGNSRLLTWIYRIAINVCIDRRKRKIDNVSSLDEMEMDPSDGKITELSNHEKSLYNRESSELIGRCISYLPPNESAVVTLFYLEGFSYEEISSTLKMPIGSVSTALHRGQRRLADMLRNRKDDL